MLIKKILILLPIIIFVILLQSFFWVPTYDEQVRGNPKRLEEFITASTGDAKVLNPILHADSASGAIVDQAFDGLIDRDENLRFRGRLATDWQVYEEAYLVVNPQAVVAAPRAGGAQTLRDLILSARERMKEGSSPLAQSLRNIEAIEIIAPETKEEELRVPGPDTNNDGVPDPVEVKVRVHMPPRLKMTLIEVDQELFSNLEEVLGRDYFESFPYDDYIEILTPGQGDQVSPLYPAVLPVTEHNPVIVFNLREGVTFHDGQPFDADDVRFTYEAIMNPKNLSPRTSDYEPVKDLEVLDNYRVKITYKRLYSPAFGTWAMGMLPEHLLNAAALKKEAVSKGADPETFTMRDSDFNRNPVGTGPFV
ncbi:MAG: hypothetical protein JSU90_03110, partial [Nitrospiraceae bacterium]